MVHSIRVGIVTAAFFYVPYWAGVQGGRYARYGLDVDVKVLGGIEAVTRALRSGEIDIGVGSPEHVIHDVEAGGSLRMVGGNVNRLTHSLITQPGIERLEDLRGKKIGVSALTAGTSSLFMAVLAERGLTHLRDYEVVEVGAVPPRHELLMRGDIDAAMQTDPHNYIAEDAGLNNLGPLSQWIPEFQFTSINVREPWAQAHEAQLVQFLRATVETTSWMMRDREGAVDVASAFMDMERKYLWRAWEDHTSGAMSKDLHLSRAGIDAELALMRRDRHRTFHIDPLATADKYVTLGWLQRAQQLAGVPQCLLV